MDDQPRHQFDESGDLDEKAIRRFRRAWDAAGSASIADYVPPPASARRRGTLVALIQVDQKRRWRFDQCKKVEGYLREWPELEGDYDVLIDLLQNEFEASAERGTPLASSEIQQRLSGVNTGPYLAALARKALRIRSVRDGLIRLLAGGGANGPRTGLVVDEKYALIRRIGGGSMGEVWLAQHRRLKQPRVLKMMRRSLVADPLLRRRFFQEAQNAASCTQGWPPDVKVILQTFEGKDAAVVPLLQEIRRAPRSRSATPTVTLVGWDLLTRSVRPAFLPLALPSPLPVGQADSPMASLPDGKM